MSTLCWLPQVAELPQPIQREAQTIEALGAMLYPYWLVEFRVHVKAPLLPRVTRQWRAAVDGVTGVPFVTQPNLPVVERDPRSQEASSGVRILSITPFVLAAEDLDRDRLTRTLLPYASRRLRSWMNVSVEIGDARPVYKELRLFNVDFRNGSKALIALDTVTGEYGVAPPEAVPAALTHAGGMARQSEDGP